MRRKIVGFSRDEAGDWRAHLDCLHRQHVRHRPPFQERPWVMTDEGRAGRIGSDIDCQLCDRAELPDGLRLVRTVGPFDAETLPAGLQRAHRVARATWGLVRVTEGAVGFSMETEPPLARRLLAGDAQALPPGVAHQLTLEGPVRVEVDFLVADADGGGGGGRPEAGPGPTEAP